MERAIKERDQHCVWPGCTQSRHLHIHHIKHWADGGATSVSNGACLCSGHHRLVHEGGYTIQRVDNNDQRMDEQFVQQQQNGDISMFEFERVLRNSRASFNAVRKLSPTQYRFGIADAHGNDILDQPNTHIPDARHWPTYQSRCSPEPQDSTRIACSESAADYCYSENNTSYTQLMTFETPFTQQHECAFG